MFKPLNVGPQPGSDGAPINQRAGKTGEGVVTDLHGKFFEQNLRGNLFNAANQAAQAVTVALATTYTGLALYNPAGSGKMLVLTHSKFALTVAPAAIASIGLIGGIGLTGTASTLAKSAQIGNESTGVGLIYTSATISGPRWVSHLVDGFTAAALPAPSGLVYHDGRIIVLPGAYVAHGALTAVTGMGEFGWEEVGV